MFCKIYLSDVVKSPHEKKQLNEDPCNKNGCHWIVSDSSTSHEGQKGTEQDVLGHGLHDPAGTHQVVEAGAEGCKLECMNKSNE